MCGFAGTIAWEESSRISREALEAMSRAIAHRGPDGVGYHLTREHEPITRDTPQVALAFRRLAILDCDERANQPMHLGELVLVYNGELYNFRELKVELSKLRPDYEWRTTGDTEVVALALEVWWEKALARFNGMFALAVWDSRRNELLLARDRMGQKPLYVTAHDGGIAFASELGALKRLPNWSELSQIDNDHLHEYLQLGYFPLGGSVYLGVGQLAPNAYERVRFDKRESHDYGMPKRDAKPHESVRSVIESAVQRQLVSDVPLGVFLSGGIDSSVIACCARKFGEVQTFSIAFDDPRYDETRYAQEVANRLGTKHHVFHVTPDAVKDLPQLARVFGEPFGDSSALPTHYLSRATREFVKVALSGDGGDEVFGGYDRYRAMNMRIPAFARHFAKLIRQTHPKSRRARLKRLLESAHLPSWKRYQSYVQLFDFEAIRQLMPGLRRSEDESVLRIWSRSENPVLAARAWDMRVYLPDDLLTKVDRASMLHGLEVRSPFMDPDVVAFGNSLPVDRLLGKRALREAFEKELPRSVFHRRKMGFAVPIGQWFRTSLKPMLQETLLATSSFANQHFDMQGVQKLLVEHESEEVDHSQRLYALLMLELWWKQEREYWK